MNSWKFNDRYPSFLPSFSRRSFFFFRDGRVKKNTAYCLISERVSVSYSKENKENDNIKTSVQAEPIAVGSSRPRSRLLIQSNKEKKNQIFDPD
jgi:hypothetical protein